MHFELAVMMDAETGTLNHGRIDFVQEYDYVSLDDANAECEKMKEESAGWSDGSVQVSSPAIKLQGLIILKHRILLGMPKNKEPSVKLPRKILNTVTRVMTDFL